MRTCAPAVALVVGLSLSACASLEDVAPGTTVTCSSAAECPSGLVCNHGRCANPNALDTTPPDLVWGLRGLASRASGRASPSPSRSR